MSDERSEYVGVVNTPMDVEGFPVVIAEASGLRIDGVTRDHMRIIGKGDSESFGRPIIYADTYTKGPEDQVFAYARHKVSQSTFFELLESFLRKISSEFTELFRKPQPKKAHCVFQSNGDFYEVDLPFAPDMFRAYSSQPLDFMRLYAPFGDMTIEFTEQPVTVSDEFSFIKDRLLSPKIESPLFAFDASRSDTWVSFLGDIHWASHVIPRNALIAIINMSARVPL
jgi:hypothetical protein